MIWNINGNVITVGEHHFATNARWFVEYSTNQKLKTTAITAFKMLIEDVSCGVAIDYDGYRQIAKLEKSSMGLVVLSAFFVGKKNNCCVFAKIGIDKYWIVSINEKGFITGSLDNDKCHTLETLKKFIFQEMIMSDDQDSYTIVNIGDETELNSVELNSVLIHEPLDLASISSIETGGVVAERQIGFRRTQMAVAIGGVCAAVVGCGYYFFYVTPPVISDIMNGMYSDDFTQQYNSLKNEEEKLFDVNSRPKTKIDIENDALDEFNEFLLMRSESNTSKARSMIEMMDALPRRMDGWSFTSLSVRDSSLSAVYSRISDFPISLSYKKLDSDLENRMTKDGVVLSPMRLLDDGKVRVYEVKNISSSVKGDALEYSKYLANKRKNIEGRQKLISAIKDEQAKINRVKSSIEESEQSVELLSAFDAHNSDVVELILGSIDDDIKKTKPLVAAVKKDLLKLKSYRRIQPPANNNYMLDSSEADAAFIGLLQSIENISWSQPIKTSVFPSSIKTKDKALMGFVGITGYEFKVTLNSKASPMAGINDLLNDERLFLMGANLVIGDKGLPKITLMFEYFVKS